MSTCLVCGAPDAEPHFGGISCRACAAFFRRYFHSKKSVISCTCQIRFQNSHPCRECRIQKCLEAGMTPEKVQHKREKHPVKKVKEPPVTQRLSISPPSSSSSSPPCLPMSPMPVGFVEMCVRMAASPNAQLQIIPRDDSNIFHLVSKWLTIQDKRSVLYGKRLDEITYYDACESTKIDCEIMWNAIEVVFPQLEALSGWDKDALLRNFHPKWSLLVAAIDLHKNREVYLDVTTVEEYCDMIVKFYTKSIYGKCQMEPKEILRVFEPFLTYYGVYLALPICAKKFDPMEYMALALITFFDGAHTNISGDCADLCHSIRNQILRELRGYHSNMNCGGEMRFIETIDTLQLIEKGESKFQEELLLLEMYNVHIHEDYRLMIREHNY